MRSPPPLTDFSHPARVEDYQKQGRLDLTVDDEGQPIILHLIRSSPTRSHRRPRSWRVSSFACLAQLRHGKPGQPWQLPPVGTKSSQRLKAITHHRSDLPGPMATPTAGVFTDREGLEGPTAPPLRLY